MLARRSYYRMHVLDNLTDTHNREDFACLWFLFVLVILEDSPEILAVYQKKQELFQAKTFVFNFSQLIMYEVNIS